MIYVDGKEVIVSSREGDTYNGKYVMANTRRLFKRVIEMVFDDWKRDNNSSLVVQKNNNHISQSALVRNTIFLNVIAGRGYKNVLFVGYYDENEHSSEWVGTLKEKITEDSIPYEASAISHIADFNLTTLIAPAMQKFYGYDFDMTVALPPAQRNQGVIHALYRATGVQHTRMNKQYKFGSESTTLNNPIPDGEYKYDAVVFSNMPKKYGDTEFTSDEIKAVWAPYCQPDFEIFDMHYGSEDLGRFLDKHNRKDVEPQLTKAYSVKAETDTSMLSGRPIHFKSGLRQMNVY